MKKLITSIAVLCIIGAGLCSCGEKTTQIENKEAAVSETSTETVQTNEEMFSDKDYKSDYEDFVTVTLADGNTSCSGNGVEITENIITVKNSGAYLFKGKLTDGQIVVDVGDNEKVQLIFDNADVTSKGSAAVYVKNGDKVFAIMKDGSSNSFSSVGEFSAKDENNIDGTFFSKSDITFTGNGSAVINSECGHGIVSKDDLKFTGGVYTITAAKKGLSANDRLYADGGTYTINSGTDGIHCSNDENTELGLISLMNGTFEIKSENDCIDGSGKITLSGGKYNLISGGGTANAPERAENRFGRFGGRDFSEQQNTAAEDTESFKAIKSDAEIIVSGGEYAIDSADDAVHSNGVISFIDGIAEIKAGDDAFHADDVLNISGGNIKVTACYEGLEANVLNISGGDINVVSSDDGMNAAGGNDTVNYDRFSGNSDSGINISGGNIVLCTNGDGIDSNGYLKISGGNVTVSGPFGTGNGAVDYQTEGVISGGVLAASGDAGMCMNFGEASSQCSVLHIFGAVHEKGEQITLSDSSGNVVLSMIPENSYQSVVLSTNALSVGETYTITAGTESSDIKIENIITGAGSHMGGGGMGGRFDRPHGNRPEMPVDGNMGNRQPPDKRIGFNEQQQGKVEQ